MSQHSFTLSPQGNITSKGEHFSLSRSHSHEAVSKNREIPSPNFWSRDSFLGACRSFCYYVVEDGSMGQAGFRSEEEEKEHRNRTRAVATAKMPKQMRTHGKFGGLLFAHKHIYIYTNTSPSFSRGLRLLLFSAHPQRRQRL